ncbi:helix-turn-helix domain-containing protein [Roseobacteraceae bacterium S113]
MGVHLVFSENLKALSENEVSVAAAAREIGVTRVQFSRYLKGEAVPRPAELQRICDYFGVDARVLLEPLADIQADIAQRDAEKGLHGTISTATAHAELSFQEHEFPAGLYVLWRRSFAFPDKIVRLLMQVTVSGEGRMLRGYDYASLYHVGGVGGARRVSKQEREYRAVLFNQADRGQTVGIFFHHAPTLVVSTMHLMPNTFTVQPQHTGFVVLMRAADPSHRRMSNCVFERVEVTPQRLVQLAHSQDFLAPQDVPPSILAVVDRDVDQ